MNIPFLFGALLYIRYKNLHSCVILDADLKRENHTFAAFNYHTIYQII